jgi:hypothetical protein
MPDEGYIALVESGMLDLVELVTISESEHLGYAHLVK